ncbi:hypothetical protein CRUP_035462 [Coryphaenoides rupestris]|nr:hypothetical protein CRUP_035462 [Coryphaenoides rupestris]
MAERSDSGGVRVQVLLSFSAFSRPTTVPAGAGPGVLKETFLSVYGHRVDVVRNKCVLQIYSDEWGQYVDVPEGFTVVNKCKLRLVPLQSQATPLGNLSPDTTAFLCCDMQERFRPAIKYFDDIVIVGQRLIQGAHLLGSPLIVSEQVPKGLGSTVPELDISDATVVFPKTKFSMVLPDVEAFLATYPHVRSLVLFGVETHVCIQQTALDLIGRGYEVHVVADGTSSRSMVDRMFALKRMAHCGIIISTSESVLLQLVEDKEHPKFKAVQSLIKASAPESGLLLHA